MMTLFRLRWKGASLEHDNQALLYRFESLSARARFSTLYARDLGNGSPKFPVCRFTADELVNMDDLHPKSPW
jgi:hypothetical protein